MSKPRKQSAELTYSEAAAIVGCGERQLRRHIQDYPNTVKPLRYGHRTVRLEFSQVMDLKRLLHRQAIAGRGL